MFWPLRIFRVQIDVRDGKSGARQARVKVLAASSTGEDVMTNMTGQKICVKSQLKRIMLQIGYDGRELNARAELFRRVGDEVISVADNGAGKRALSLFCDVDVSVIGHTAPGHTTKERVDWLKANSPRVEIVVLIPSVARQLHCADYNVVVNDLAATASRLLSCYARLACA